MVFYCQQLEDQRIVQKRCLQPLIENMLTREQRGECAKTVKVALEINTLSQKVPFLILHAQTHTHTHTCQTHLSYRCLYQYKQRCYTKTRQMPRETAGRTNQPKQTTSPEKQKVNQLRPTPQLAIATHTPTITVIIDNESYSLQPSCLSL